MVAIKTIIEFIIIILAVFIAIFLIITNWNTLADRIMSWIESLGGLLRIS